MGEPKSDWDMTKALVYGGGAMLAALLALVAAVVLVQVLRTGEIASEVWAQVVGLIGLFAGVAGTVYAYRFGSSSSSRDKDAVIGGIVEERKP